MTQTEADRKLKSSRLAIHLTDDLPELQNQLHTYVLMRTFNLQCERMRNFISDANADRDSLKSIVDALRQLMAVEAFRALLNAEGFATMPATLAERSLGERLNARLAHEKPNHIGAASQQLVGGICYEALDLLADCSVNPKIFGLLQKVLPTRQVDVAKLMIALDRVKVNVAKVLIALTPQSQLIESSTLGKPFAGIDAAQLAAMEVEFAVLSHEFQSAADAHGARSLELVGARSYIIRLLEDVRVVMYLAKDYPELLTGLRMAMLEESPDCKEALAKVLP